MSFAYRRLENTDNYMPLTCSPEEFKAEYKACYKKKNRDKTLLYEMVSMWADWWLDLFKSDDKGSRIQYLILCKKIDLLTEPLAAPDIINTYLEEIRYISSFKEDVKKVFKHHLNHNIFRVKFPNNIRPRTLQRIVNLEFIRYLGMRMVSVAKKTIDTVPIALTLIPEEYREDFHIDYYAHEHFIKPGFEKYMFYLKLIPLVKREKENMLQRTFDKFYIEDKQSCTKIKKLYETIPPLVTKKLLLKDSPSRSDG